MGSNVSDKLEKKIIWQYQFISGAIAGISETIIMYPLDVVKTRMQLQSVGNQIYTGITGCLINIIRNEGITHLYRGITSPILMEMPKRATKFACNDKYQNFLKALFNKRDLTQPIAIFSGTLAGITESMIIVPFELVKIRLQAFNSNYKTPNQVVRRIIRKDGILGLYVGLEATIWRNSIWNSGYFGLMFFVRSFIPSNTSKIDQAKYNFVGGMIGGGCSCFLSVPFDVVKSQVQSTVDTLSCRKHEWAIPLIIRLVKDQGFKAMYKGITPIICRYAPGGGLLSLVYTSINDIFYRFSV